MMPYVYGAAIGFAFVACVIALTGCAPNYPGAGYVGLGLVLDREHAAEQEKSRQVAREIGLPRGDE